jgi:23S rRNA pseudouridine1911/1915/1917 synthase
MKQTIKVNKAHQGLRLDLFLLGDLLSHESRSSIQHKIKNQDIVVNGASVKTGYQLKVDDVIEITEKEPKKLNIDAVDLNLDIVYEDDDLAVINKPQGLVVHPATTYLEPTLVHGLMHQMENLSSINGIIRPGIVHRIDKDTSGLLIIAKNDNSHQILSQELKDHDIERTYLALVYGKFNEKRGTIDAPIARHPKNRLKMAIVESGKHAKTHFEVLETFDQYSLLSCKLETGRTHQIRVHMAYINHPVVGDPIYGPKEVIGKEGQFLHAKSISFMHPTKKEQMTFTAKLPQNFEDFLMILRGESHE